MLRSQLRFVGTLARGKAARSKVIKVREVERKKMIKSLKKAEKQQRRRRKVTLAEERVLDEESAKRERDLFVKAATSGLEDLEEGDFDSMYRELMGSSTAQLTTLRLPWADQDEEDMSALPDPKRWEPPSPTVLLSLIPNATALPTVAEDQLNSQLPLEKIMLKLKEKGKTVSRVQEVEALAVAFAERGDVDNVIEVLKTLYPRNVSQRDKFVGGLMERVATADEVVWSRDRVPSLGKEGKTGVEEWVSKAGLVKLWNYLCSDALVSPNILETYVKIHQSHPHTHLFLPHLLELILAPPPSVPIPTLASYSTILSAILSPSVPTTHRSTFWDLYAHLRFVSHPTVNEEVYATIIHGCSSKSLPGDGLERARDLWIEMEDAGIIPGTKSYNAMIHVNANSMTTIGKKELYDRDQFWGSPKDSKKMFARNLNCYFEALRLLQKMITEGVFPDRKTFGEILEASKKMGDVERARWVLLKMVEGSNVRRKAILKRLEQEGFQGTEWEAALVDPLAPTEVEVAQVLSAYALFTVPIDGPLRPYRFREDPEVLQRQPQGMVAQFESEKKIVEAIDTAASDNSTKKETRKKLQQFPGPVPTTHGEVLAEAYGLFRRCLGPKGQDILMASQSTLQIGAFITETSLKSDEEWKTPLDANDCRPIPALAQVSINSELLRSYLHVYARHSTLESCVGIWRDLFPRFNIAPDSTSFVIMLRKCLRSGGRYGPHVAMKIFREFRARTEPPSGSLDGFKPEDVTLVWSTMIELLAKFDDLSTAAQLVDQFYQLYPPNDVVLKAKAMMDYHHSSETTTVPLIRLSDSQYPETQPSNIAVARSLAPLLEFRPMKLFHHKLMQQGENSVKKLTTVLDEYRRATEQVQTLIDSLFDKNRSEKERKGLLALEGSTMGGLVNSDELEFGYGEPLGDPEELEEHEEEESVGDKDESFEVEEFQLNNVDFEDGQRVKL